MPKKIIIYGISAYAEIMHYKFDKYSDYTVIAFCVDQMFVAIGFSQMRNRKILFDKAKNKGYALVNFISPKAVIHDNLILGENNVIQSSVDIDIFVTIGDNNVFWTGSILGHNLVVGNHNYISGGGGLEEIVLLETLVF